jgi:hypothetical protein
LLGHLGVDENKIRGDCVQEIFTSVAGEFIFSSDQLA